MLEIINVPPIMPPGITNLVPDIVVEFFIAFFIGGAICILLLAIGEKIVDAIGGGIGRFFGGICMITGLIVMGYIFYLVFD